MSRLLALPLMAVILGLLACGTSATESPPTLAPTASSAAATTPTSVTAPIDQPGQPGQPEEGVDVGKTVPDFEFTLSDGTVRSTAVLASQGKPVFLFFFTTW